MISLSQEALRDNDKSNDTLNISVTNSSSDTSTIYLYPMQEVALSDLVLAQLGYYSQEEFYALVYNAMKNHTDSALYKDRFSYEEILNRKYYWYPNDEVFERKNDSLDLDPLVNNFNYKYRMY